MSFVSKLGRSLGTRFKHPRTVHVNSKDPPSDPIPPPDPIPPSLEATPISQYIHQPTETSAALLSTFPQELIDEILFYVSEKDISQLSLCSKSWRNLTISILCHRIKWKSTAEAGLFDDGGFLADLRPVVRHITMYFPSRPEDLIGTIDTYRIWMDVFCLFPNIKTLQIELYTVTELEANMIKAIFTKLSTSPAFATLQSLSIERQFIGHLHGSIYQLSRPHNTELFTTLQVYVGLLLSLDDYYEALPKRIRDFLGPRIEELDAPPPLPKGLTKLGVSLPAFRPASAPETSKDLNIVIHTAMETIRELRVMADIFTPIPDQITSNVALQLDFSHLAHVTIIINRYSLTHLKNIGQWLPNVRFLAVSNGPAIHNRFLTVDISGIFSQQEQVMCKAIEGMRFLKRVRLPWPYTYDDRYNIGIYIMDRWPKEYFDQLRLENLVDRWVKAGAEDLERVTFATESYFTNGRDDKTLIINIRKKGLGYTGGWRLESKESNDRTYKPYDRDIPV